MVVKLRDFSRAIVCREGYVSWSGCAVVAVPAP